jgi:outer membrane protein assembly factor BamE (lipoprotein component of BamABCDE complex)
MPAILAVYVVIAISGSCLTGILLARKRFGLSLLVFLVLMPAALVGWYQATRVDKVAAWLYPSDTVYAGRFNPGQFRRVAEGMSQRELLELLGQPFERRTIADRQEYWYYSRHGARSQNYWNFIVIVDPTAGKVVNRFKEFYTD